MLWQSREEDEEGKGKRVEEEQKVRKGLKKNKEGKKERKRREGIKKEK